MQASNIVTWYTRPARQFDSFYCYNTGTRQLVRVRLELKRSDNDGPIAMYRENRYIGFANGLPESLTKDNCNVVNGDIVVKSNNKKLANVPSNGLNVYDFSSSNNSTPDRTPHKGNTVVSPGELPPNIDEAVLMKLVNKCLAAKSDIPLGNANIKPEELSAAIIKAASS